MLRLAHISVRTIHDNVDRIKESAKSGTKVFVFVARLPQSLPNKPYQKLWMRVSYTFITLEMNKYTAYKCMYTTQKCVHTVHMYSTGSYVH
jgi:hypothetical protein